MKILRDIELEELRDTRPTPIMKRWQPLRQDRAEKTRSVELPKKIDIKEFLSDISQKEEDVEDAVKRFEKGLIL